MTKESVLFDPFKTIWVIGLGTTGSALAALLARHNFRVFCIEQDADVLWRGKERVRRHVVDAIGVPEGDEVDPHRVLANVDYTSRMERARVPDVVIEAVPERLDLKVEVLRRAHELCHPDTVFVSTTTGLPVTELAARTGRMTRTVGVHLCTPWSASAARVLELVRTPVTDDSVLDEIAGLVRALGKEPVVVADHPGFVGGALMMAYLNRAARMYEEGYAGRDDIDVAMRLGCGLPLGPLEQLDAIGIDVAADSLTALYERTRDHSYLPAPILGRMVSAGLRGRKTGRGFYRYQPDEDGRLHQVRAAGAPGSSSSAGVLAVRRVGVVGAGTMATGIAEVCARSGFPTTLVARTEVRTKEARASVERSLNRAVRRGKLTAQDREGALARLVTSTQLADLRECDLVIEAVTEDLAVKRAVFTELDKAVRSGAILASTTSSLSLLECALATGRPREVVGMHFFNPASVMRLVEVAATFLTAQEVVDTVHMFGAALGKTTVNCGDRTGFIVNRLLFPYLNQAVAMLRTRHVRAEDVDRIMRDGCGYPTGPFQLLDLIGLDVSLSIQNSLCRALDENGLAPDPFLAELAAAGHLGQKTGQGFHLYEPARPAFSGKM